MSQLYITQYASIYYRYITVQDIITTNGCYWYISVEHVPSDVPLQQTWHTIGRDLSEVVRLFLWCFEFGSEATVFGLRNATFWSGPLGRRMHGPSLQAAAEIPSQALKCRDLTNVNKCSAMPSQEKIRKVDQETLDRIQEASIKWPKRFVESQSQICVHAVPFWHVWPNMLRSWAFGQLKL